MTDDPTETMEPAEALRWLDSEAACRVFCASRRKKIRRRIRKMMSQPTEDATVRWEAAAKNLYAFVCSDPWAVSIRAYLSGIGLLSENAAENAKNSQRRGHYPPPVERADLRMRTCCECSIPVPCNAAYNSAQASKRNDRPEGYYCDACCQGEGQPDDPNRYRSVLVQRYGKDDK